MWGIYKTLTQLRILLRRVSQLEAIVRPRHVDCPAELVSLRLIEYLFDRHPILFAPGRNRNKTNRQLILETPREDLREEETHSTHHATEIRGSK